MKLNSSVNIPSDSKIVVVKNVNADYAKINIFIKNKKFIFVKTFCIGANIIFDKWCNSIVFNLKKTNPKLLKNENSFKKFFKSLNIYYYSKIKFKGKGFRIKFLKKNKIVKFFFGRSHITYVLLKKIMKKRINKYKFILRSINEKKLNIIKKKITNIKKFNFYTLRGIRLSRQIIFKRKGKKGTYI